MFVTSTRLNYVFAALFVVASGCGGGALGCGSCGSQPLPGGALPSDQTVEGGGQIRITGAGFAKVSDLVETVVGNAFDSGTCIGQLEVGSPGDIFGAGAIVCDTNQGSCTNGCNLQFSDLHVDAAPAGNVLNVEVSLDIDAAIPVEGIVSILSIGTCTIDIHANDLTADVDIEFSINNDTGELEINLAGINNLRFNLDSSGCLIGDILSFITDISDELNDIFGGFLQDLLTPVINPLIQDMLPDPLGIAGMLDVGDLLSGVSPGTVAEMEARLVPGGYVNLGHNGLSLGLITGFNADEDITTRTAALDSEPAYCVPPIPAPNFAAPPASLSMNAHRGTFILDVANEFNGVPDPATDLAIGLSETTLDLLGHHMTTSGGMCLGIGSTLISQLNVGTIGILVPSLGELASDEGNDPLMLVTRPQRALDFSIGEGTEADPALTIHIQNLEVDF